MTGKNNKKRIVVYGGAFNPPHLGHAAAVEIVSRFFPCGEIWLLPSADRPDKKIGVNGEHRLKMVEIMAKELFGDSKIPVRVSDLEIKRSKLTTTFDTKTELEKLYPDFEFHFLVGSDILGDIEEKWMKGKELWRTANFVAVERRGFALPKRLPPRLAIFKVGRPFPRVSSTAVRKLFQKDGTPADYLSSGVLKYAEKNNLYEK